MSFVVTFMHIQTLKFYYILLTVIYVLPGEEVSILRRKKAESIAAILSLINQAREYDQIAGVKTEANERKGRFLML